MTELLNTIVQGEGAPLVIAHGLFGSARNWNVIARRLSDSRKVVAVDMRNHGESFRADAHGYEEMAEDLAAIIDAHGGKADVLGHSMGGKAAMLLALLSPRKVSRLIVADIAPVAYGHTQMEYVRAMQGVDLVGITRRAEVEEQLLGDVPDPALRAFFLQSIELGEGGARWRLNLAALAGEMDKILGFPDVSGRFDGPVHFLRGGNSDYVAPQSEPRIRALFPAARIETLPGVGHWPHAEAPREFEAALRSMLAD